MQTPVYSHANSASAALKDHLLSLPCRCTADCGWVTGHSYLTYGPMLNGATNVVFEGTPTYPTPARCWEVIAKYQVRQLP